MANPRFLKNIYSVQKQQYARSNLAIKRFLQIFICRLLKVGESTALLVEPGLTWSSVQLLDNMWGKANDWQPHSKMSTILGAVHCLHHSGPFAEPTSPSWLNLLPHFSSTLTSILRPLPVLWCTVSSYLFFSHWFLDAAKLPDSHSMQSKPIYT